MVGFPRGTYPGWAVRVGVSRIHIAYYRNIQRHHTEIEQNLPGRGGGVSTPSPGHSCRKGGGNWMGEMIISACIRNLPAGEVYCCSETMLTGESQFHTSTPRGFEPGSLVTGSKRVVHWTSETWWEWSEIAGSAHCTVYITVSDWRVLVLSLKAHLQTVESVLNYIKPSSHTLFISQTSMFPSLFDSARLINPLCGNFHGIPGFWTEDIDMDRKSPPLHHHGLRTYEWDIFGRKILTFLYLPPLSDWSWEIILIISDKICMNILFSINWDTLVYCN